MLFLLFPALKLVQMAFPAQSNIFAAVVLKPNMPKDLLPWLLLDCKKLLLNLRWFDEKYEK